MNRYMLLGMSALFLLVYSVSSCSARPADCIDALNCEPDERLLPQSCSSLADYINKFAGKNKSCFSNSDCVIVGGGGTECEGGGVYIVLNKSFEKQAQMYMDIFRKRGCAEYHFQSAPADVRNASAICSVPSESSKSNFCYIGAGRMGCRTPKDELSVRVPD